MSGISTERAALPGDEYRFDHHSAKMTSTPWSVWARLRNECPVAHSEAHGGHYVLTTYEDVTAAATDAVTFSSDGDGLGVAIPPQETRPLYPIDADPPIQREYRSILNPFLSPARVAAMEPWVRKLARAGVQKLPADGTFDVAALFTLPFPRMVAFTLLDLPIDELETISHQVDIASSERGPAGQAAGAAIYAKLAETIGRRRSQDHRDDLVGALLTGTAEGRPLTEQEIMSMMLLLLFGGLETTSATLAAMLLWLSDHPEDLARMLADPSLMKTAADEFVRWASPVAHIARTATDDIEIRDCPISKGSRVLLSYGSANRDTTVFERADEVILDRFPNRHIGFGMGPHRCVGSHLAKLQIRVAFEEFTGRYADFEVADYNAVRWSPGETRYIRSLPLTVGEKVSR